MDINLRIALYYVIVRDKCETLMSIFLSWLQFMITCLKLCPTWWTFKRRLRNRGHFLNTYNKNVFQPSLCTAAPSAQKKKKKRRKKLTGRLSEAKKIKINIIYFYLFVYLIQFDGLLNAQSFPPPRVDPPALAFFSPWMGWGPLSCQISRGGDEFPVLSQHCNIFHWLHRRVVPWDLLFQLTSSFEIVLQCNLSLRTPL